jgi:hypothetical protein
MPAGACDESSVLSLSEPDPESVLDRKMFLAGVKTLAAALDTVLNKSIIKFCN